MVLIWNARLTLLNVYQAPYNSCYLLDGYAYEALQEHRHFREYVFRLLGQEVRERYSKCRTEFPSGKFRDETVKAAKDLRADLVIIRTHGKQRFRRIAYGSDAEAIVRRAPCPVLVLHEPNEEALKNS